ncbi:reticulon-like protein B9 [Rhodamnia argentea]|uniref:Reticulon-like protein n=1 Tax=Rhodamnia argentea TaxID=178133 RepID=A0A8B8NGV7_9MYRT|nr:reticulon-like protein B9 [Rhodamnia argentea]
MPTYASDSDTDTAPLGKLFGRQRSMHEVLGGGQVADILLWRNRNVSAALLAGTTLIWFLFEVVEYNFVTLLCHLSLTAMLVIFIWQKAAEIFNWEAPKIPQVMFTFDHIASTFHGRFNQLLLELIYIASGRNFGQFILAIIVLYVLSLIGSCCSFLNLLYLGLFCMETVPFLYDRYEEEVDRLVGRMVREMRRVYRRLDAQFLNKIPRGPVKEKKTR